MIEVLPVKSLTDEDGSIFGSLNVGLGKLARLSIPVGNGVVVTAPNLKLKTTLEHYDFGTKEVFEQSLTLVKKEVYSTPLPGILKKEIGKHKHFLVRGFVVKSQKDLWLLLLNIWIEQIKIRLWKDGFYKGIAEGLEAVVVTFLNILESLGSAYFDPVQDDTSVNVKAGKLHPNDLKIIDGIVKGANKKLFLPHEYEWIVDRGVKLVGIKQYTPPVIESTFDKLSVNSAKQSSNMEQTASDSLNPRNDKVSVVKVFLDLSKGEIIEKNVDGIFISSEKIFDLNTPRESFENLIFKLVESANNFPNSPVLFKLADKSEGMGKVRGSLRLLHQASLFNPLIEVLDFVRHKKGLNNIHIVIPFVRSLSEFLQIKRELSIKKLMRKASLQHWLEITVPENIVNLDDYLEAGLDGVVLNLDELVAHMNGFDSTQEELLFYKNETKGLIEFLEDGLKLLHKGKVPFIAYGSLSLYPQVLEFLVEKGVFGIVVERYEAPSANELLHQVEKRLVLRRSS